MGTRTNSVAHADKLPSRRSATPHDVVLCTKIRYASLVSPTTYTGVHPSFPLYFPASIFQPLKYVCISVPWYLLIAHPCTYYHCHVLQGCCVLPHGL